MSLRILSRPGGLGLAGASALCLLYGCGLKQLDAPAPLPERPTAESVLYLVGDAGDPETGGPVLSFVREDAARYVRDAHVAIAFLGDNIYEKGLHEPGHPDRGHDVEALELQLGAVRGTGARGIFIAGNHDWAYGGERGLTQIRRQADYVNDAASEGLDVVFLPEGGCPGPVAERLGESVLLVALDTEWLLRYEDPPPEPLDCEPGSAAEAYRALRELLTRPEATSRHVIVFAHHTLKTNGPHGGYFSLKDQFFPLTNLWGPLYLPVPFLYPIGRNSGVSAQDMSNPRNRRMRDSLVAAVADSPRRPLAFASGHEHTLQVFEGSGFGTGWLLVSGAGSRLRELEKGDALFAAGAQHGERGFMRLEFFADGSVLLSVVTDGAGTCRARSSDDCALTPTVRYWSWLRRGR